MQLVGLKEAAKALADKNSPGSEADRKKLSESLSALSKQMQDMKKKLKGQATIYVARSNLIRRTLDKAGIKGMDEHVQGPSGIVFSDLNPFKLEKLIYGCKTKAAASVRAKRKKPKDAGDWGSGENRAERMFDASVENCQCAGAAYYSTFLSVIAKYIGRFDARRGRAFAGDCRGFEHIGSIISDAFADAQRPTQPRE